MSGEPRSSQRCRWLVLFGGFLGGIVLTVCVGAVTKATDQAAFCVSCHSMAEAAWTHKQSVHAKEDCNSCHLPAGGIGRYTMKAATGFHDIFVTFTSSIPASIQATPSMKKVVNDNCMRCHESTVSKVNMTSKAFCVDCHTSVPHMRKKPIDQRRAADV